MLLLEAASGSDGYILRRRTLAGVDVQTNGRQFVEKGNSRSRAAWEGAVEELQTSGLIEDIRGDKSIFQLTRKGYAVSESLKP